LLLPFPAEEEKQKRLAEMMGNAKDHDQARRETVRRWVGRVWRGWGRREVEWVAGKAEGLPRKRMRQIDPLPPSFTRTLSLT
jgi:hypothetical protein